ncbi:MAG TPA: carboxypeptidase M32 [Anaerolineales bacterium]|nr:carboxypeptidase M32 [Anaerolineales bacterium]
MEPTQQLAQLKEILNELSDLQAILGLLGWDQQTYMPPGGTKGRGHQRGTLTRLIHLKFTAPEVGQLLAGLQPYVASLDADSDDARLVKVISRRYHKLTKVPADLVAEIARTAGEAHLAWEEARASSDFAHFRPHLERIVDLRRQYASHFAPFDHIYDPLLDDFEPGLKTAEVQAIFAELRPQQVALIQAISARPQLDDAFLHQPFDVQKQWDFGVEVITQFGYDWKRGRQDKAAHPFTQGLGSGDVRITTRLFPDYFASALFSTMHEAGHALYGQGIDPGLDRLLLGRGASLAVHESQSRSYENLVGRSRPFWQHFYPRLQEYFPAELGNVDLEQFYRGINKVERSLIRVEADEATYNLHIMLRLEIEIALIEGSLQVKDLPEAWNSAMQATLGLTPPNDAQGVLQDVHWSGGMLGYFSTYALGNLISAQLWECVHQDIPDLPEQIGRGEFAPLTGWMREKIHRHGAKFEPQELVERITGSKINPAAYMRYLKQKYGEIYAV